MAKNVRIYDDGTYLRNNPTWHEEDSAWKVRQISRLLEETSLDPTTVYEVGCGAGGVIAGLAARRPQQRFVGFEISPQALDLCRTKVIENLDFLLGDIRDLNPEVADVLMAIDVVEHVEDYLGFLREIRCYAKHHVFHIPLDLSVQTVLRSSPILQARADFGHLHTFSKETALATLTDAGYEIVRWAYTPTSIELPNRSRRAQVFSVPRRACFALHPDLAVRVLGGYSLLVLAR